MDQKYTLRLFDGDRHYDFPCYQESDQPKVFHTIKDNYPIRAVREKDGTYEYLRNVSRTRKECTILEKIEWSNPWQVQMFYYTNEKNKKLYITGSTMDIITPPESSNLKNIKFNGSSSVIKADFNNMDFDIRNHNGYQKLHAPNSPISCLYNESGNTLFLGFEKEINEVNSELAN
jgi:hypothetical protein